MFKKALVLLVGCMLAVGLLSSCATIIDGKTQQIVIDSNVKGATIKIDDVVMGKTPATITLKKQKVPRRLTIEKNGHETKVVIMGKKTSPWFWANIFVGLVGSSTDSSTGAMYNYAPDGYFIELPVKTSHYQEKAKMRYFVLMNHDRINKDIARGEGEYLKAVCAFYGVTKTAEVKALLPFFRKAQGEAKSIVEFGDLLVARI